MSDRSSYERTDTLPNGKTFEYWSCRTTFSKTWYVDGSSPNADDNNPGTEDAPFRTIRRAASVVCPGERVYIRKGCYFETIRDVRGGTDPEHMILFEGEDGAVLTGAIGWTPDFVPSEGHRETPVEFEHELFHMTPENDGYSKSGAQVWMASLPSDGSIYEFGYNPFLIMNVPTMSWVPRRNSAPTIMMRGNRSILDIDAHMRRRGQVFMDGRELKQVVRAYELWEQDDVWFMDDTYKKIHIHLKNNDHPADHHFQLVVKEQAFMPDTAGLGYIYFKNLTFDKFANPVKCPQYGALCSNCGHHFIIERCVFSSMNSIGLDLGFIGHAFLHEGIRGHHIVRKCLFRDCGVGGLSAVPTRGFHLENMLIENNIFYNTSNQDFERLFESAAIKNHYTRDSLYRFNYIDRVDYGCGIWLDKENGNSRVTHNVIRNLNSTHGAIFNEATLDADLFDHNILANIRKYHFPEDIEPPFGGHGFYEHECDGCLVLNNVIANCEGEAVHFHHTLPEHRRLLGDELRAPDGRGNIAAGNSLYACPNGILLSEPGESAENNTVSEVPLPAFYDEAFAPLTEALEAKKPLAYCLDLWKKISETVFDM